MSSPAGVKGSKAEREAAALLTERSGYPVRRKLGAGRKDDVGDLDGIPDTVLQVAHWADVTAAALQKPRGAEIQRINAKARYAAALIRFRGKDNYRVVMTLDQFFAILHDALAHSNPELPPFAAPETPCLYSPFGD